MVEKGAEQAASRIRSPPQGDRKGPHPAPHLIITHIFLGSLVERNYRAELVHKRYHAKCLVTSVHRNAPKDMGNDDTMRTKGSLLATDHGKGGGGVEWGGDPCGRPGGMQCVGERALARGSVLPPRAMQASPPRSTPPPPLREWMRLKTLHTGILNNLPLWLPWLGLISPLQDWWEY